MISRQLLEWQTLPHGEGSDQIPEIMAARLSDLARKSIFAGRGLEGVLEHRRNGIRARGVIGVLAATGVQLEILPKIESRADGQGDPDKGQLRKRLVHMLCVAQNLRIDVSNISRLDWQRHTLLEILISLMVDQLKDAARRGMPRRYLAHSDDLPSLRGRLNVTRQFSVLAASPQRLACHYDELSPDIILNQAMKAAILHLGRLSSSEENQKKLRELSHIYADISDVPVSQIRWDSIIIDRNNRRWNDLVNLVRLLLGQRYQETSAGEQHGHGLLFEMNVLFERYLANQMRRMLAAPFPNLRVSAQSRGHSCLFDGERRLFQTKPDIIIYNKIGKPVLIIDAKWKKLSSQIEDKKQGISQSDVYQLMAYSQLYDCKKVMLIYPHRRAMGDERVWCDFGIGAGDAEARLFVASADLSSELTGEGSRMDGGETLKDQILSWISQAGLDG